MSIDRKSTTPCFYSHGVWSKAQLVRDSDPDCAVDTVMHNHVKFQCEWCANFSESPVQNSSDQSTFRPKIPNEFRRFKPFTKTLDHGIECFESQPPNHALRHGFLGILTAVTTPQTCSSLYQ